MGEYTRGETKKQTWLVVTIGINGTCWGEEEKGNKRSSFVSDWSDQVDGGTNNWNYKGWLGGLEKVEKNVLTVLGWKNMR